MKIKLTLSNTIVFLAFLILSYAIYANSLQNKFVFDDIHVILNNAFIKNLSNFPQIFRTEVFYFSGSVDSNYYRPLYIFSQALIYKVWGLNTYGYHFTNILLHALNALLFFRLLKLLFKNSRFSLLVSFLFLIHPLEGSCVNAMFCKDTLLYVLFGLYSMILLLPERKAYGVVYYCWALLLFLLSLLCKENAVLFIPLFLICAFKINKNLKRMAIDTLGLIAVLGVYLFIRFIFAGIGSPFYNKSLHTGFFLGIANFFNVIAQYLWLYIFPFNLHIEHTAPFVNSLISPFGISVLLFSAGLILLFISSLIKKKEFIWFGIAWFVVSLLSLFRTIYLKPRLGALICEHWAYLASLGFFIILGSLLIRLFFKHRTVFFFLLAFITVSWISLGIYNNSFWKDEFSFNRHALKINPRLNDCRMGLATAYYFAGDYDNAAIEFRKAIEIEPYSWDAYLGLGNIYLARGKIDSAEGMYKMALKIYPNTEIIWNNLGLIYRKQNKYQEAFNAYFQSLKLNPFYDIAYSNLGDLYAQNKDYKNAVVYYKKAAELDPDKERNFLKLASAYMAQGQEDKAAESLALALQINPDCAKELRE